jgi:hypothetical protein
MTATENGFDRRGKNDKNFRENVKVKVRVVAAVPFLALSFFQRPSRAFTLRPIVLKV